MLLSVIIPTFNNSSILSKSLKTWESQSIDEEAYEILVVNNNSSDNTDAVALKFVEANSNFSYYSEPRPGATNARHRGARESKGDILVFADDDGLYNTDCLKSIKEAFEAMPEVGAVACKIDILWNGDEPEWIKPYLFMLGKLDYGSKMFSKQNIYFNSGLFAIKRSVFEELHGFNPDLVGGKIIGDGDTGLVMKMWDAGIPIGWAPGAVMQHIQQVDKHGTVEGVALHFYNVGVANSYALFRKNNFKNNGHVLIYRLRTFALYLKKWVQYNVLKQQDKRIYFSLKQREGELAFFRNLNDPEIRKEVMKKDLY